MSRKETELNNRLAAGRGASSGAHRKVWSRVLETGSHREVVKQVWNIDKNNKIHLKSDLVTGASSI